MKKIKSKLFSIYLKFWPFLLKLSLFLFKPNLKSSKIYIFFAGQYYNGNLKSLYEEFKKMEKFAKRDFEIAWVAGNRKNILKFQKEGVKTLWFYNPILLPLFCKAHIWINDRGPGDIPVPKIKKSFWIQVWHGIPFKGFAGSINTKNFFNTCDFHPVSSTWLKDYYVKKIGVKSEKVFVTGYPRIDRLLGNYYDKNKIIKNIGFKSGEKIILYAPTWEHESNCKKPLFPFGDELKFIKELISFLEKNKLQMIIRLHPNYSSFDGRILDLIKNTDRIILNSVKEEWDTEKFLYISDVLITDWSSIANDYIVLNRPIIFIDIPIKLFRHGFALLPKDRAGYIVKNEKEFFDSILESISNPGKHREKREKLIKRIHFKLDTENSKRVIKAMEYIYEIKFLKKYAR